jgi:hypothetical protein
MTDLKAIEGRIWSIPDVYRDRLEPSTIYGIPVDCSSDIRHHISSTEPERSSSARFACGCLVLPA